MGKHPFHRESTGPSVPTCDERHSLPLNSILSKQWVCQWKTLENADGCGGRRES
jgi:hypothetical protein